MYISLAESRAKGFMKWANTYQPEGVVMLAPERTRIASSRLQISISFLNFR